MRYLVSPRSLHRLGLVVMASLLASTTACDDDDDPTGLPSAAGTYELSIIEETGFAACTLGTTGCTLNNTGTEVVIVDDGTLALSANGSFTIVVNGSTDGVDEELGSAAGTWVRTQNGVTLNVTGIAVPLTGTLSSNGDLLVFTIPASLFSSQASGNVTVTFDKQ
jgi:hypothetical protein